jgi:hypothetical protein
MNIILMPVPCLKSDRNEYYINARAMFEERS